MIIRWDKDKQECRSSTPIPVALQVCSESRQEALKFYNLVFGAKDLCEEFGHMGRVFIDFEIDSVYVLSDNSSQLPGLPFGTTEDVIARLDYHHKHIERCVDLGQMMAKTEDLEKIKVFAIGIGALATMLDLGSELSLEECQRRLSCTLW